MLSIARIPLEPCTFGTCLHRHAVRGARTCAVAQSPCSRISSGLLVDSLEALAVQSSVVSCAGLGFRVVAAKSHGLLVYTVQTSHERGWFNERPLALVAIYCNQMALFYGTSQSGSDIWNDEGALGWLLGSWERRVYMSGWKPQMQGKVARTDDAC